MQVNFYVKSPKDYLNYHYTSFEANDSVNFHIPTLLKEVSQSTRKQKRQYKKIITSFLATASSTLLLSSKSMANSVPPSQSIPVTKLPTTADVPAELMEIMSTLLVISTSLAVFICIGMLILAGLLRALRKRKESTEWTTDIIKGLVQVIVAAPLVFLIYYVASSLFGGTGWFINPFSI